MRLMRSWLFVPGHRQKMLAKALGLRLDVAILDLEDGVPPAEKAAARDLVAAALDTQQQGPLRFVRINAAGNDEMAADLAAVVRPGLAGLVMPKVQAPAGVNQVDALLQEQEVKAGLPVESVRLLATIESARGLVQAPAIAAASPRLIGLMFGAEDFALDLGMLTIRQGEAGDLLYARSAVVVAAASAHVQAVDRVYVDIRNQDGLRRDTRQARQLGFTGKALIHPSQIEVVHQVFQPTAEEVEYARRVVAAFEAAEAAGEGAIAVDGRMVDLPIVARARRVLHLHQKMMGSR